METTTEIKIKLTKFQLGEVANRLAVYNDEGWTPFGAVDERTLVFTISNVADCLDEIENMIEVFPDMFDLSQESIAGVRSLRSLAAKIEQAAS